MLANHREVARQGSVKEDPLFFLRPDRCVRCSEKFAQDSVGLPDVIRAHLLTTDGHLQRP